MSRISQKSVPWYIYYTKSQYTWLLGAFFFCLWHDFLTASIGGSKNGVPSQKKISKVSVIVRSLKEVPLERLFFFPSKKNLKSHCHSALTERSPFRASFLFPFKRQCPGTFTKKSLCRGYFWECEPRDGSGLSRTRDLWEFFFEYFFFLLTALECRSPLERPVVNNVLVSYNTVSEVNNVLVSHNTVRRPVGNNELGLFNTVITSFLGNQLRICPQGR